MKKEYLNFKSSKDIEKIIERIRDMGSDVKLNKSYSDSNGKIYHREWLVTRNKKKNE